MNDGMYTNIRNYLEEIASRQKQLLAAVQRTNELLAGGATKTAAKPTDNAPKVPRRDDKPVEGLAAMETMTAPKTTPKKGK